jgi:hypothetical protein
VIDSGAKIEALLVTGQMILDLIILGSSQGHRGRDHLPPGSGGHKTPALRGTTDTASQVG